MGTAEISALAPGDVLHPDISDPTHEEVRPEMEIIHELKNLKAIDQIPWSDFNCCPPLIRDVPKHWVQSFAEAKHGVVTSLLKEFHSASSPERNLNLNRYWKLLAAIDGMIFHRPPRTRGGRKGQESASLNRLFSDRLRSFWSGDWLQLWLEVESTVTKASNVSHELSFSHEATNKRVVQAIDKLLENNAVSKAIGRILEPMQFASGDGVKDRLQTMFPQPLEA